MIVVSNTSPLRYLISVGQSELLQNIFGKVLIPRAVELELTHPSAPLVVRQWMARRPEWIEVHDLAASPEIALVRQLDGGEAEAIQLAMDLHAGTLIMDERSGREMAANRRITVIGILGVLLESFRRGTIDSPADIVNQLQRQGFRISRRLLLQFQEQIAVERRNS